MIVRFIGEFPYVSVDLSEPERSPDKREVADGTASRCMSKSSASARGFRPRHLERMSDSDTITRLNAALEGRYRIEVELGEGGMATVYLADDLRQERTLDRDSLDRLLDDVRYDLGSPRVAVP